MNFELIKIDIENDFVTIVESGYKYNMPSALYNDLKKYTVQFTFVSRWYKQLSDEDRERVIRVSAYE